MKSTITVCGLVTQILSCVETLQEFNLGSRKQIGEYLLTLVGSQKDLHLLVKPIVDEKTLSEVTHIHEAKVSLQSFFYCKRNV